MRRKSILALIIIIGASAIAYAQSGLGELVGFVRTEEGALLPGAKITATSPSLLGTRRVMSNDKGYYRIISLPPGNYILTITKKDYTQQEITNLAVRAGKTSNLNITMQLGTFESTVTIVHEAPLIDLKNPERQMNIDGDFVSRMPLSPSREWAQVWSLVPGVDFAGAYSANNRDALDDITVHGGSTSQNMFALDGMSLNAVDGNANSTTFSTEIIEDIQVVTGGYSAALSPGTGGYINVVTKSGGNDLSGSAVLTYQPEEWNWSNVPGGDAPKVESYIPELSLGGPIMKDRVWFFNAYRYDKQTNGIARTAEQLATYDLLELPRPTWSAETSGHRYFGKITTNLTDADKVVFTYNYDKNYHLGGKYTWYYADDAIGRMTSGGNMYVIDYSRIWSDNFTTTLKGSYHNYEYGSDAGYNAGQTIIRYEALRILPFGIYGDYSKASIYYNGAGEVLDREGQQTEIRLDANYYVNDFHGAHDVSFGFNGRPDSEAEYHWIYGEEFDRGSEGKNAQGQWVIFYTLGHQISDEVTAKYGSKTWGGYVQDNWVVRDRLTVNLGLRIQRDYDNAGGAYKSGSLGFNLGGTYALTSDQRQSIRLSVARKAEEINGTFSFNSIGGDPYGGYTYRYDDNLDGVFDRIITDPAPGRPTVDYNDDPTITYADDFGPALTDNIQIGYTAVLPLNLKFDGTFIYQISYNNQISIYNDWIWEGDEIVGVKNPDYSYTTKYLNDKYSSVHYHALELMLSKNFSEGWQLIASYTYQDQTLKGDWNPEDWEVHYFPADWFETSHYGNLAPHLFNLAASAVLPWDITFNANINMRTGYYERPRLEYDIDAPSPPPTITLSDGTEAINPLFNASIYQQARSAERYQMSGVANVNLGLGKQFSFDRYRLTVQAQLFNIFNAGDYQVIDDYSIYYEPNGKPLREYEFRDLQSPRAVQLLLKLTF